MVTWGRRDGDMRETREEWPNNKDGGSTCVAPHSTDKSIIRGREEGGVYCNDCKRLRDL